MDHLYRVLANLVWWVYLTIEAARPIITPDLYLDRSGHPCTIEAGTVITFGVRHD